MARASRPWDRNMGETPMPLGCGHALFEMLYAARQMDSGRCLLIYILPASAVFRFRRTPAVGGLAFGGALGPCRTSV